MIIAVLGKSRYNKLLEEQLINEGLSPVFLEDVDSIGSVSGEAGEFRIKTGEGIVDADCIIAASEPSELCLNGSSSDKKTPAVILLDYPAESPAYMTGAALEKAIFLAGKQRKVIFLFKFLRISGSGLDELYNRARSLGVSFIKYNFVDISKNEDTGVFKININDGYDDIAIETLTLIKESDASRLAMKLSGLLKLKLDRGMQASGGSFFLSPTVTSRKGVFFLDGAMAGSLTDEIIKQIDFTISEIRAMAAENTEYAEVDAGKCAFCYTCFRACPHSAMIPDYDNSAMKNLNNACEACGICVAVCPADAIVIKGRELTRNSPVPNSLMIYGCENSGEIALGSLAGELSGKYDRISTASVACGGEITAERILEALKSYEKVLYVTCKDEACRHFDGNKRARLQTERAKEMLKAAGLDENRIMYLQISPAMPRVLQETISALVG